MHMKKTKFINCKKCNKIMKDPGVLHYKNGYPCLICKGCIYKELFDNDYNEKFVKKWCKEFDIPFLRKEWNHFLDLAKERVDLSEPFAYMHIPAFGKYLSYMKLHDWIDYTYKDGIELTRWRIEHEE